MKAALPIVAWGVGMIHYESCPTKSGRSESFLLDERKSSENMELDVKL